jgi:hypothetical protein
MKNAAKLHKTASRLAFGSSEDLNPSLSYSIDKILNHIIILNLWHYTKRSWHDF